VTAPRVLIVEDEVSIARPLVASLRREGFTPHVAYSAAEGLMEFTEWRPDAIVLDLMLPDGDGRDVCRELRALSDVPIVMVTARSDPIDRVVGLELGADDYVMKPFSPRELAARIRAVLRRAHGRAGEEPVRIGKVSLDPRIRAVTMAGQRTHLPAREFDLLHLLMRKAGRVVRREEIMDELWGGDWFGSSKTLDVHVARLRAKLAEDRYITTIRGIGFRFATDDDLPD
jgi:two-component system, OmpR family, response regulator RegX3